MEGKATAAEESNDHQKDIVKASVNGQEEEEEKSLPKEVLTEEQKAQTMKESLARLIS